MKNDISVIILAAGNSSRMGKPKFLLEMPNRKVFLEHIIKQYFDFGCENIIVVFNEAGYKTAVEYYRYLPSKTQFIINPNHELGRFSSIKIGIKQISTSHVFIHNVDNPYAKKEVLDQIYSERLNADVVKPVMNNKGGHPVLISKKICEDILLEKDDNLNLKGILSKYLTMKVEVNDKSILLNINTNEELEEFRFVENR